METLNLIISITVGAITIIGTIVAVCIGWGKIQQLVKDISSELKEFKADTKNDLSDIKKENRERDKDLSELKGCISTLDLKRFSESNSPLKLKDDFRKMIIEGGIDKQIADNETEIINLTRQQSEIETELEAQNALIMVTSVLRENKVVDFSEIDKIAYNQGLTLKEVNIIVSVYLWESLIPKLLVK